jgi:hypothetical protein
MDEINKKLNDINKKLDNLTEKIDILLEKNCVISDNCKKMSLHIDFINIIYDKIQYPFWNIINFSKKYLIYNNSNKIKLI